MPAENLKEPGKYSLFFFTFSSQILVVYKDLRDKISIRVLLKSRFFWNEFSF